MDALPALDFTPAVGEHAFTAKQRSLLALAHELGRDRFAARAAYARTVEDVLARRSRLLFLDAALAPRLGPAVGRILRAGNGDALEKWRPDAGHDQALAPLLQGPA